MNRNFRQALWYAALGGGGVMLTGYTASIPFEPEGRGLTTAVRVLFAGVSTVLALATLAHGVLALALFTGWVDSVEHSGVRAVLKKNGKLVAQGKVRMVVKLAEGVGGDQPDSACVLFFCGWRPYLCYAQSLVREP
ncbi:MULTISPECIES: hypothetical protein [unclassified Lysobacter]|uniref:hypothetical protein n=1 Tax=unclassified Lysobacter TaxID=2635362 RepID=UPI001BEA186D|nr:MULTISPECIES: hypothetical protein [unclassified Lysobacter]MBT2745868.1 hypothetical protein [Lysobacter sp. ISL-42]MBT2749573.1 hypothetical protein [Lysobacter sp. ISL-50]MBT2778783.1 hypothetical protein [Lysobacter sp. ISL-54]MBT2781378.1 hypothetical protein [Lysobacter sp. ISL-52]